MESAMINRLNYINNELNRKLNANCMMDYGLFSVGFVMHFEDRKLRVNVNYDLIDNNSLDLLVEHIIACAKKTYLEGFYRINPLTT